MALFQIKKNMKEKKIAILYFLIGAAAMFYGMEQLLGYLLFLMPVNISWWIGFISILFGICILCRGKELYLEKS